MLKKNKKWILVCLISKVKTKQKDKQKNFESPTLFNPMDCSLPGSSVHGILQPRILEQVAISFSRGSSWPRDQTQVSCIIGRFFTFWAILYVYNLSIKNTSLKKKKHKKSEFLMKRQKFFYIKLMNLFGCFVIGMTQKLHPHIPHFSHWLKILGKIQNNLKTEK